MSKCDICGKEIPPGKELYQDDDGRFVQSLADAVPDTSTVCQWCARGIIERDPRKARR